jgi:hypothetical protein
MQSLHDRVAKLGGGLDCSGLTMTSYGEAGLHIPLAAAQQTIGAEIPSIDQLLPGERPGGGVVGVRRHGLRGPAMVEARHRVQISTIRTSTLASPSSVLPGRPVSPPGASGSRDVPPT